MKKTLSLVCINLSLFAFAQCNIIGPGIIKTNEKASYRIETENAQCTNCYKWAIQDNKDFIKGDARKSAIDIVANREANVILSLAILTTSGIEQCSRHINIAVADHKEFDEHPKPIDEKTCDIPNLNYTEVKYALGKLILIPEQDNPDFSYTWISTLKNAEKIESKERNPQFSYSDENPIETIQLVLSSKKCTKLSIRTYKEEFWQQNQ